MDLNATSAAQTHESSRNNHHNHHPTTDLQVTRFPYTPEGTFYNGSLMIETFSSTVLRNLTFLGNVELR